MIEAVLKVLEAGFHLWAKKEENKPQDRMWELQQKTIKLKREYYEEMAKPNNQRSDAVLDDIVLELRFVADSFSVIAQDKQGAPTR